MSNTLVLKSSILGEHSSSNQLIDQVFQANSNTTVRDLAVDTLPILDLNVASALRGSEDELNDEQKALLTLSNQLVAELKAADTLVIGAPMYNFMIPTQLKNWIDLITRAGVTFTYTENGPLGLVENTKAIIVTTRGGIHKDTDRDAIHGYLKTLLGFIGITDVEFVFAEALNMGDEPADLARKAAQQELAALI
ncbi:FMN-dependent NADH-azoreductase [Vibrio sp. AK197]